jgi:hypothetical protein
MQPLSDHGIDGFHVVGDEGVKVGQFHVAFRTGRRIRAHEKARC